jgi:hypothetical protein
MTNWEQLYNPMRRFLLKTLFYVILILGGFELLYRLGYYPVVTDSSNFDYKMMWIGQHSLKKVELAAMGSSVPLYGIESTQIAEKLPLSYFNFSSWHIRMTECWMLVHTVVRDYRPKYILLGSNLGDFALPPDSTYLNYTRESSFVRRRLPELFYLLDFHSIHQMFYRRLRIREEAFDAWGGSKWVLDRRLLIGFADNVIPQTMTLPFDQNQQRNYRALDSMSRWLAGQRIKLIFAQFPIIPRSMAADSIRMKVLRHIQTCKSIVEANGGVFLNYSDSLEDSESLFTGSIHLLPKGARIFTGILVNDLERIVGQNR